MTQSTVIYKSQEHYYQIVAVEGIGHFIKVICDDIAMYERMIALKDSDLVKLNDDGHLDELAYDITKGEMKHRETVKIDGNIKRLNDPTSTCSECGSKFCPEESRMMGLCSECSHLLYGYEKCNHVMVNSICCVCGWDGSYSEYTKSLRNNSEQGAQPDAFGAG